MGHETWAGKPKVTLAGCLAGLTLLVVFWGGAFPSLPSALAQPAQPAAQPAKPAAQPAKPAADENGNAKPGNERNTAKPDGDKPDGEAPVGEEPREVDELALKQSRVADKYARLEELMARMATFEATSNPRRAALLKQAVQASKERLTLTQLNAIARLLNENSLDKALEGQATAQGELKALLELLQSENRADRLKSEQARIREYIKEVERLIRLEKSVQGRTEGGEDARELAKDQDQIAQRAGDLADKIRENEEGGAPRNGTEEKPGDSQDAPGKDAPGKDSQGKDSQGKPGETAPPGDTKPSDSPMPAGKPNEKPSDAKPTDSKPSDSKPSDSKPSDSKPSDSKPSDSKPSDSKPSDSKPSDSKPSDSKPSDSKPSDSKPSDSKPSDSKPSGKPGESGESPSSKPMTEPAQPENPARKRIEAAEERMREAQRKLAEAKRKEAVEEQQNAREELEKAKAALEEILRQMREEERERVLAALEGRFRKMLEQELKIYEGTKRLDQIPVAERGDDVRILSGRLSLDQRKVMVDADKALTLLLEEGSSIALPATVEQIRDDMEQVSDRLETTEVGSITQGVEEDIIAALEEVIEALQKAQQDLEQKKQQDQQQQQQQQQQDDPLVDQLAELKMIRSLQLRVNNRTKRYARLLDNEDDPVGAASDRDLRDALRKLSEKQGDIQRITRDIVLGKNKKD